MPIYEYNCQKCGSQFEKLLKAGSGDEIACPDCGSDRVEKVLSSFATGTAAPQACYSGG